MSQGTQRKTQKIKHNLSLIHRLWKPSSSIPLFIKQEKTDTKRQMETMTDDSAMPLPASLVPNTSPSLPSFWTQLRKSQSTLISETIHASATCLQEPSPRDSTLQKNDSPTAPGCEASTQKMEAHDVSQRIIHLIYQENQVSLRQLLKSTSFAQALQPSREVFYKTLINDLQSEMRKWTSEGKIHDRLHMVANFLDGWYERALLVEQYERDRTTVLNGPDIMKQRLGFLPELPWEDADRLTTGAMTKRYQDIKQSLDSLWFEMDQEDHPSLKTEQWLRILRGLQDFQGCVKEGSPCVDSAIKVVLVENLIRPDGISARIAACQSTVEDIVVPSDSPMNPRIQFTRRQEADSRLRKRDKLHRLTLSQLLTQFRGHSLLLPSSSCHTSGSMEQALQHLEDLARSMSKTHRKSSIRSFPSSSSHPKPWPQARPEQIQRLLRLSQHAIVHFYDEKVQRESSNKMHDIHEVEQQQVYQGMMDHVEDAVIIPCDSCGFRRFVKKEHATTYLDGGHRFHCDDLTTVFPSQCGSLDNLLQLQCSSSGFGKHAIEYENDKLENAMNQTRETKRRRAKPYVDMEAEEKRGPDIDGGHSTGLFGPPPLEKCERDNAPHLKREDVEVFQSVAGVLRKNTLKA